MFCRRSQVVVTPPPTPDVDDAKSAPSKDSVPEKSRFLVLGRREHKNLVQSWAPALNQSGNQFVRKGVSENPFITQSEREFHCEC